MTALQAALDQFAAHFGGEPDGVWEAPGRVNLIGEHTDYNAGLVLPIALPQRAYAVARRREDTLVRLVSDGMPVGQPIALADIAPGHPKDWERYPAGVLWALAEAGHKVGGMDVAFASDVPVGSGLSSSAAIEGAMGAAAADLFGLSLLADDTGRTMLAQICQRAENVIAEAPTGGMDQAASIRAREGYALNLDCADQSVKHIPFRLSDHALSLLVIDTRVSHSHST
ncbi:MAG: galactokinase, partial [Propionibacteriaceae bacterium]|nr:galactokinase [Propionibacteriaceae bacterium]